MLDKADKAELNQAIKAYYIPSSLFLATLCGSAGVSLVYEHQSFGYVLILVAVLVMVSAFVMLAHFQNRLRVSGVVPSTERGEREPAEPATPVGDNYGCGVRAEVFEVIVRQAMAGAPWREICAGSMQVNNITPEQIEAEVKRRQETAFRGARN